MRARVQGGGLKAFSAYRLKSCLKGTFIVRGFDLEEVRYLSWEVIMTFVV